jgi:hypothetical protein
MMPDKSFWFMAALMLILFVLGVVVGHTQDTRLSDVGVQTEVQLAACGNGTYVVQSKEQRCSLIYKTTELTGTYINIKRIALNEDGLCVCPEGE